MAALQPALLFSVGPRNVEGQHGRGDPCWGMPGRGEILPAAAVRGCAWHGPWLIAGLGPAHQHGMVRE